MKEDLMKLHHDYIAKCKAKGIKFGAYPCPKKSCGFDIETRIPPKGETWDTLATCPKCGDVHLRIATAKGVKIEKLPTRPRKVAA